MRGTPTTAGRRRSRSAGQSRRCAGIAAFCALVALALPPGQPLRAATVYKTVDENGVVSFSDTRPASEAPVETLEIRVQTPELSESAEAQLEAMRETTDRMVSDRQQREKHRAEMRQQAAEELGQAQPQQVEYEAYNGSNGFYSPYYYPYRPGGGYRPRPHPRPPIRPRPPRPLPPGEVISPGHDYPGSLIRRSYSPQVRAAFEK